MSNLQKNRANATTGQILGKAHRLCEWLRQENTMLYPKIGTVPLSWLVDTSTKWHVGHVDSLPNGLDRETIDSFPLCLPVKQMLIEFETSTLMADGREEESDGFTLCLDRGDQQIDCFFFGLVLGEFQYFGGGMLVYDQVNECRRFDIYIGDESRSEKTIRNGVKIVERVLVALSCTNVRSVDNVPSQALNKKRMRQGKQPLFTYKTLHIISGERGGQHDAIVTDAEARKGPRLHFRRGHVRRIGDGKITWVQQCMVGSKRRGVVEKAYALHPKPDNAGGQPTAQKK